MFYMETVYLQMAASRELAKEQLRSHDEQDDRPKADSAQARSRHEDALRQTGPTREVSLTALGVWSAGRAPVGEAKRAREASARRTMEGASSL
jgi:hypothetical protein